LFFDPEFEELEKTRDYLGRFVMDLSSVGEVKEVFTLVDYYTYIKSMEYLICVAFFVGFPMFYRYINKEEERPAADDDH